MIREFTIVEIMLPGVSGEVGGAVSIDGWSGAVENVDCQYFDFWCDQRDVPIVLDAQQRALAEDIVRRTLECDSELTTCSEPYLASAAAIEVAATNTRPESERVLAQYLQSIRQADDVPEVEDGSQVRRFG